MSEKLPAESADETDQRRGMPYYIDDPLVDRDAHRLSLHTDEAAAELGYRATFGTCSCGEWTTPTWDDDSVLGAFDDHMSDIQATAHRRAEDDAR